MPPEEWAYWQAHYRLHPWGDDWERDSVMTTSLYNLIHALASPEPVNLPSDAFVPFRQRRDVNEESLSQSIASLKGLRF